MRRKIMVCLIAIPLLLTSCGKENKTDPDPDPLSIMCNVYEANIFDHLFAKTGYDKPICTVPDSGNVHGRWNAIPPENWDDKLHIALLSGSSDVDIYSIRSLEANSYKIISDRYYVDLAQDKALRGYFGAMVPEIRDWCTRDGEVFGFPSLMDYPMLIWMDEEKMRSIGYGASDIGTADGLIRFCDQWGDQSSVPAYDCGHMPVEYYFMNYLYAHYDRENGALALDTPEFRQILEQCRALYLGGGIFGDYRTESIGTNLISSYSPLFLNCDNLLIENREYRPVVYPQIPGEADSSRYCSVCWLIVNPASKKRQEAMDFLAAFAKNQRNYKDNFLYIQEGVYEGVTEERIRTLHDFVGQHFLAYSFPGEGKVRGILYAYVCGGTKTLDEAIAEAQDLLDTVRQEQYIGEE